MKLPMADFCRRAVHSILFRSLRWLKAHDKADGMLNEAARLWYDLPVDPCHFYSPLPDVRRARRMLGRWRQPSEMPGLAMSVERQASFAAELKPFASECAHLPTFREITEAGYGEGYGEVEAHFLHCMIRYLKPRRIVEIGSGVSTCFGLNALDMNPKTPEGARPAMHCIEPYPSKKLQALAEEKRITLDAREVQDVPPSFFEYLGEGDILFIDSSHVGKIDSDVYHLYLEVLPRLRPGVVIHIHDITFPHLTCPPEHPVFPFSMLWNEAALCQAFLAFNNTFDVLVCQSYLHHKQPSALRDLLSVYDPARHFPSSLWLRRVAGKVIPT